MRLTALLLGLAALVAALPMTARADDVVRERSPLTVERRSEARPLSESSQSRAEKPLHGGFSGRIHSARSSGGIVFERHGRNTHVSVRFGYPARQQAACRYVDGYYTSETRYVVVPGYYEERVIPARFGDRWDPCARRYVRVRLAPRRVVRTWVPECTEARQVRVFVPGRWVCDASCGRHDHGHADRRDRHDRRDDRHDDRHDRRRDDGRHDRGGRY